MKGIFMRLIAYNLGSSNKHKSMPFYLLQASTHYLQTQMKGLPFTYADQTIPVLF